jgi:hypothetical protein
MFGNTAGSNRSEALEQANGNAARGGTQTRRTDSKARKPPASKPLDDFDPRLKAALRKSFELMGED